MLAQLQIINKILNTKDYSIVTLNNLDDRYFFNYKNEFNFIKNHIKTNNIVPDITTFLNIFPDFELQEVNEPDSYLLEQLFKDYNASYIATRFNKLKEMLESGETDKAVEYFKSSVENLKTGGAVSCIDITKNTDRYKNYLDMQTNRDKYFIPTGFPELDKAIYGIDTKNENMVIVARSGLGKSWTLLKMAASASLLGKTVGIYSGEMSVDKVGYRLDTLISGISNRAITHGDLEAMKDYKNYIESLPQRGLGPIKIITPNMISGPATVDALEAFVEQENVEILFIDQYSLLEDTSKATTSFEKVANISKAVKQLQVKKQIPIISVAQQNRFKNEDKSLDLTQIGLSDRIGQDATCVLMLDRKLVENKTDPTKKPQDNLIINITKNRDGGTGKLTYAADFNTGEFIFIPENIDKDTAQAIKNSYTPTINSNPF